MLRPLTRQCTVVLVSLLAASFSIHQVTATGTTSTAEYDIPPQHQHQQQYRHQRRRMGEGDLQEYYDYMAQFDINGTNFLVGGDDDADTSLYPWFVHFGSKTCSGSLISPNRVLTSATCLQQTGVPSLVRVGATNQRNGLLRQVACAKTYPDYQMTKGAAATIIGDIAILKLIKPVPNRVQPVTLHTLNQPILASDQSFLALGMGLNQPNLEQVELDFVSTEECQQNYGVNGATIIQSSVHLCATGKNKGLCTGDSGSPLVVFWDKDDSTTLATQVGVASFTYGECGDKDIPDVFTPVIHYSEWIQSQLTDNSCDGDPATTAQSQIPSEMPSQMPSVSTTPSTAPTDQPSINPTVSQSPSISPTTLSPTAEELLSSNPSSSPSFAPSDQPSVDPSSNPSSGPSSGPSQEPSVAPSHEPTSNPTTSPTETSPTPMPTPSPLATYAEQLIETVGNFIQWKEEWKQNILPGIVPAWFNN